MKEWLRRWLGIERRRGTLTFFGDGRIILGLPDGATQEEAAMARDRLREYLSSSASIVIFPWPVDVVDRRGGR